MFGRLVLGFVAAAATALFLTGAGAFGNFTSSVTGTNAITSGTFQLQAVPSGSPSVSGPLIGDANPTGQPVQSLTASAEPTVVGQGNTLSYSLVNASPGDTYTYQFTVYDVGTLQGEVDTISYNPGTPTPGTLEQNMTVEVEEQVNGVWTPIHTTTASGAPGVPESAAGRYTFYLDYSFGPAFLQPNTLVNGQPTYTGDENSATFRVVFAFNASAPNSAENATASPAISVNGAVTP